MINRLRRLMIALAIIATPLIVGLSISPEAAFACHGQGVSRVCNFPGSVRLEAVSYSSLVGFDWLWTRGDYYQWYGYLFGGELYCQNDWRCVHGWNAGGDASQYQVYGQHWFQHGSYSWYTVGDTWSDGQCAPPENYGC